MKAGVKKHAILLTQPIKKRDLHRDLHGFTLFETLVAIIIIGVLAAIASPSWLSQINKQRLNAAKNEAFQAIRTAQHNAKLNHIDWQISFREVDGLVQWVTYPDGTIPGNSPWRSLDPNVRIDKETTLYFDQANKIYRLRFDYLGRVSGQLGRITFSSKTDSKTKRCVIVSTLLGAMREGEEHASPRDNKYCY